MSWSSRLQFAVAFLAGITLSGCAALGKTVRLMNPTTGEETTTTVGDIAADTVDSVGAVVADVATSVATAATANPVVGTGAGAAVIALLGLAASKLRRRP